MKKHPLQFLGLFILALAVAFLTPQRAAADEDDPPSRVARLSYTHGEVSFNPAGTDDWVSAVVNRPITTGDKLWTDNGSRAELHIGSAAIRLSSNTGFSFLNLTDNVSQIRVTEGTINIRVRSLENDETFEVDTPNLAFSILRPGRYRINVNEAGDTTVVVVHEGHGEVTGGGSAYTIHPREIGTFSGLDQLDSEIQSYGDDDDDFDHFCADRDRREDRSTSSRYVSRDVIGYEDLDDNGGWRPVPEYGTVWFPHTVIVGWAPYRYGHWCWISPWGWTWVDDASWGFAPFHYGRWITFGGVWGWVPCPPRVVAVEYVRPVYAPALVAWVGGPHWGVGIAVGGGGGGVAWFPLGPREVYVPSYHVSRTYVTNVNVSNTTVNNTYVTNVYNNTVINKNVNVTNVRYVNQSVPGAVTATSHANFTCAQAVGTHMMKVDAREMVNAPVATHVAPVVAPPKQAVLGSGAPAAVRPPAAVQARAVVAKTAPPPPPASFEKQQQAIKANEGRPIAISQMRQLPPERAQAAAPAVKIAPPATAGVPRNVQTSRPGNLPANAGNAPANTGNMPANAGNRPPAPNNTVQPPANNGNRPVVSNTAAQPPVNNGNRPGAANNQPSNSGNPKVYNDRPPAARPNTPNNVAPVNPQLDQKHQQQVEQLRTRQDQERQKIEQQQQQERQRLAQKNADDQRQQQLNQRHEQQLQQLEQKHEQDQQRLQQRQQQERQQSQPKPQDKPQKPPKEEKPHRG
jgi:hypothetical protein